MHCSTSFYIRDLNTCKFCYAQGSWNNFPVDTEGLQLSFGGVKFMHRFSTVQGLGAHIPNIVKGWIVLTCLCNNPTYNYFHIAPAVPPCDHSSHSTHTLTPCSGLPPPHMDALSGCSGATLYASLPQPLLIPLPLAAYTDCWAKPWRREINTFFLDFSLLFGLGPI